ncbi:hypothetical protein HK096_003141 [Nowakowskiella sp. JEL0078]|nr:hypothetical protein HK096_003141 [Nowakowskiella sp. JEL0078]
MVEYCSRIFYFAALFGFNWYLHTLYVPPQQSTFRVLIPAQQPPHNGGLSPEGLKSLPTYEFTEEMRQEAIQEQEAEDMQSTENSKAIRLVEVDPSGEHFSSRFSCAICMSDYLVGELLRKMICGHVFHQSCVDVWFQGNPDKCTLGHKTCPLCNAIQEKVDEADDTDDTSGIEAGILPEASGSNTPPGRISVVIDNMPAYSVSQVVNSDRRVETPPEYFEETHQASDSNSEVRVKIKN